MEVFVVTGMSGSGKSKTLDIFEDNGFYCLDNLPLKLMVGVMGMISALDDFPDKLCITLDVRNKDVSEEAINVLMSLKKMVNLKVLFLECDKNTLMKRYKESRRLHPLMMADSKLDLADSIQKEAGLLAELKQNADYCIDTSMLSTSDLREKIVELIPEREKNTIQLNFVAFGYKYGIPADCDLVFDVRCLPNPFYVDELKMKTGNDPEVRDFVMASENAKALYNSIVSYIDCALPMYEHEGKAQLVVGLGCTGGQHRSLSFAIMLSERYSSLGYRSFCHGRDSETNAGKYRK